MTTRESFLQRVRQAVVEGNRIVGEASLPDRGRIGYQGAGPDPVESFCRACRTAGGVPLVVDDGAAAWQHIQQVLDERRAQRIAVGAGGLVAALGLTALLRQRGCEVTPMDQAPGSDFRDRMFAADVGISNVAYLVAETGSIIMATAPSEPRSLTLLPPVHIALARRSQILADLFDLFEIFARKIAFHQEAPPSCLTIITGPSKTGDIELKLVTGVHGPGEVYVVICPDGIAAAATAPTAKR
ncbi:MAG: lactate utilization protein C [Gemmataceae bacterium]|nr:lactate utilization protein C [Gemmataceae bacterium]